MSRRTESLFVHQLRERQTLDGKLALAAEALQHAASRFDAELVETLAAELKPFYRDLSDWLESQPATASGAYLRALMASDASDANASGYWERFFSLHYTFDPSHRLAYARAAAGLGDYELAARQIQLALSQDVRYAIFPRAEKLARSVAQNISGQLRQVRVAVLGTSTTQLLVPVLETLCLRDRIRAEIYQGLYGAMEQEILDPESGLARFRPDVVFLVNHWRDLALPAVSDESETVARVAGRHKMLWERLSGQFACHVVQHAYDYAAEDPYGPLSASLAGGRARVTEAINQRLRDEAPSYVSILDTPSAQRRTGSAQWEDAGSWSRFKQHPATEAIPALAELQAAHLRAALGLSRKVLITDLDNTLWGGVIGEDGLQGIQIGPGNPAGEAHLRLQEYLKDLKTRGILLAVCSKNNPEDARLPFEKHEHMALRLEDFAAFEANWDDKAQNIRRLAEKLSLGLDSFVFLDDSPVEREWVRSQLPQVAVVEPGPTVFHYVRDLDRRQYFFAASLSKEDLVRAEQYRTESQRELLRSSSQSIDEFLAQLQLQASVVPVTAANLARVTQLANKTNQFNATTRRYTEAQIEQLAARPDSWAGAFHLTDRMGSYGLIGLIFCVAGDSPRHWIVETWLMSCRALGRQMERFMFDRLMEAAAASGVEEITGVYRPTAKNQLVENLFDNLGFTRLPQGPDETEVRYQIAVGDAPRNTATHIRDLTDRQSSSSGWRSAHSIA